MIRFSRPLRARGFWSVLWIWSGCLLLATSASAQLPQSRLYALFPTGAAKGTPVDIAITNGVDLEETSALLFSHPGIKAVSKVNVVNGQPQPVANTFTVTVDPSVPAGMYEVRSQGKYGLSNPRTFVVGDRKEADEVEPNNTRDKAQPVEVNSLINARSNGGADLDWYKLSLKAGQRVLIEGWSTLIDSKMEAVLELYSPTGRLLQLKRDKYPCTLIDFTAPADGDYLLKIYDSQYGGSNDHFYRLAVHTGPYIDFVFPPAGLPGSNGEYIVYGRNLPGGQPSPVAVQGQPLEQLKVNIQLPSDPTLLEPGRNLRAAEAAVDAVPYSITGPNGTSNAVMIGLAAGPLVAEAEPNDAVAQAQKITVPADYVGQFQARGDVDGVSFDAKAGEVFWFEVYGERSGTIADPYLTVETLVKNDKGEVTANRIAALDESYPNIRPLVFDTLTNDPAYRFQAPADGTFRVTVRDRYFESRGDPRLVYRLAIRREQHDFRLVALPAGSKPPDQQQGGEPWELVLRRGENVPVDVLAFRQDGYNGVIEINAEGLPEGVTCKPAALGAAQNLATLVFSTTEQAAIVTGPIKITGTARIDDTAKQAAVTAAEAALKAATDAAGKAKPEEKPAADQKVTEAQAAVAAAKQAFEQAAKTVSRTARGGTVVWNRGQGVPSVARVSRQLLLSVIPEAAPYQLLSDTPIKVDANQSRQVLVPVKLIKRNGFDDNVNLTFVGQPQNLQVENKPIAKGKDSEVYRIFVQNNAAPGTYTLWLRGQATVPYRRNVEAADAAAKEKEAADKALADATEANKKAAEAKVAGDKKATDTAAEAKKQAEAKVAADKVVTDSQAALKTAQDEQAAIAKKVTDADAAAKAAVDAAAKAKEAADKDANNQDLAAAKVAADKVVTDTAEALKKAQEEKVVADKKVTDAEAVVKAAVEAQTAAVKAAADADALAKKAVEEKAVSDKAAVDADAALKAATAAKAAADKKATDTANAAKPNNVNVFAPSFPVILTIKQGPAQLGVTAPNNGALKKGDKLEVKVTVNRVNGFTGPVELSLPLPPGVAGIAAAPVSIPADKNEGVLVITAAGDATEGQLTNMVVRGSMEFQGAAAVDQPIAINVVK